MLDVYKASAGSGKTYTLAKRYIRMLLGYTDSNGRRHLYRHAPMAIVLFWQSRSPTRPPKR